MCVSRRSLSRALLSLSVRWLTVVTLRNSFSNAPLSLSSAFRQAGGLDDVRVLRACHDAQLQDLALVRRRHLVQAQPLTFVDRDVCGRHGFILRQLRRRDGEFQFVDGLLVAAQPALQPALHALGIEQSAHAGCVKGGLRGNKETIDKLKLTIAATQLAQDEAVAAADVAVDKGEQLRLHGVASAHESKLLELRHETSSAPCSGVLHISAVECTRLAPMPPTQTMRPSRDPAAAEGLRSWRRAACGVHTPVARSTSCTVATDLPSCICPPSRNTCLTSPSLSSMSMAVILHILPQEKGGKLKSSPHSESISTVDTRGEDISQTSLRSRRAPRHPRPQPLPRSARLPHHPRPSPQNRRSQKSREG